MKQFFKYLALNLLFWMVVFAFQRVVFIIYNLDGIAGLAPGQILQSWWIALRMDLATTAFLMTLPLLLVMAGFFTRTKVLPLMANISTILLLLLVVVTATVDTGLYSNWGSKLNERAVFYAVAPGESMKALNAVPVWLFVLIGLGQILVFGAIWLRWLRARVIPRVRILPAMLIITGILILIPLAYRGGLQKYPLGKGSVYYTSNRCLNYAALNSSWNLVYVLTHLNNKNNPYLYYSEEQADLIFNEIHTSSCDSSLQLVKVSRPDIVLILMESISAVNMRQLGGSEDIMPGLDSLSRDGILFSSFYASGFRTEQGLVALLSGFPAQPSSTIMREFDKFERLPGLGPHLTQAGYHCNFYFSGDLEFANTGAYLRAQDFVKILDKDARKWENKTQWGAYDEELFRCHLEETGADPRPSFSIIMTSTNHEPFDADVPQHFSVKGEADAYKNTSRYTDACIADYIRQARKKDWWDHTLIIITSDHAHYWPLNSASNSAERHHIPFLLMGGAIKDEYRGRVFEQVVSQTDFPSFILAQTGMSDTAFRYSNDPLSPCVPHFAFYTFDNGFGWITDSGRLVFDHDLGQVVLTEGKTCDLRYGKAYLQVMYDEFLGR
jgi:phosphoglycerol transferase MdoB-like AlkP superfamily enzyme